MKQWYSLYVSLYSYVTTKLIYTGQLKAALWKYLIFLPFATADILKMVL